MNRMSSMFDSPVIEQRRLTMKRILLPVFRGSVLDITIDVSERFSPVVVRMLPRKRQSDNYARQRCRVATDLALKKWSPNAH